MDGTTLSHIYLVSSSYVGRSGFYEHFYLFPEGITIVRDTDKLPNRPLDCIIVPCSNPYGFKTGVPPEIRGLISDKLEHNVRNHIFSHYMGEQPIGSAFILPFVESSDTASAASSNESKPSSSSKKDKEMISGSPSTSGKERRHSKRSTSSIEVREQLASFVCWVSVGRNSESLSPDFAYNSIWSALLAIRTHNKNTPLVPKDKNDKNRRLKNIAIWAPCFSSDSSDMNLCVKQASLALKNFMTPPLEPVDAESVSRTSSLILSGGAVSTDERSKELEGLLWSRELESRGLCNEEELDILIGWVNKISEGKSSHNTAAARALVSLLRRPDTEFTLRSEEICEKIISKTGGCLTRLLEMGHTGEIELHKEIPRSELVISGKVGDGNAGSVYRAKYKGMDVAVKMFSKGTVSNSQDFIRELSLLSLMQHPLIVNCYGGSTRPGDEYIVEELMEASVYDLLHDKNFEMDMEMKLDFAISTAKCMNFLHSCGVIHRDLKSLNLLVSKTYQVKVCDFGLSRVIDNKNAMTSNIGTVSWVAPELFAKKLYTEKADVYSYGIILWELISRQMPFGDIEAFSVPLLVSRGERPEIPRDCPADWRKLMKACWHQKPTARPSFKKILSKLRLMLTALREEKAAKGEMGSDRGLFIRNSQFLQESSGLGSSDEVRTGNSSSAPYPSDSKSDSEYSSENLTLTTSFSKSTKTMDKRMSSNSNMSDK